MERGRLVRVLADSISNLKFVELIIDVLRERVFIYYKALLKAICQLVDTQ